MGAAGSPVDLAAEESGSTVAAVAATEAEAGQQAEEFSWAEQWYPLAFTSVTDKAVPHRLELFGEPLVLWWDHVREAWAVMTDECPHRLAPLSEGRIDESGRIECPYHGWTFCGKNGACEKIPQLPQNILKDEQRTARVLAESGGKSWRVEEKQGLVWVWAGDNSRADPSTIIICDALERDDFVWIDVSRDMPYSADMLLENVLDSSHVPFTHHKTISKRENAVELPLRITSTESAAGFDAEIATDLPIQMSGQEDAKTTERTSKYVAPTYMHHRIRTTGKDGTLDSGFETWTVAYATPTGPGRCRLFARFPFRFPEPKRGPNIPKLVFKWLPDWVNHMGQLKVLDDDNIFLPLQERRVQDAGGWKDTYHMPTKADVLVSAYRRWFDNHGPPPYAPYAVDEQRYRLVTKEELLDRKSQHTDHCKSCSGALKASKKVKTLCKVVALSALAVAPHLALQRSFKALGGLGVAALVTWRVWLFARNVERTLTSGIHFYPPPRNAPGDKKAARNLKTVEEGRRS